MAARAPVHLRGFIARVALNKKNLHARHKLDTDIDKYYYTLHNVIIPDFMDMVKEIPGYPERIKKCVAHTTPSYFEGWAFSTELIYKTVADKQHQTERNLEKCRIIRALMDMSYAMAGILDDYVDKGEFRRGKKVWASVCEGGQEAAIYDSIAVTYLMSLMVKRHFGTDPGYSKLIELFNMVPGTAAIGNTLDILDRHDTNYYDDTMWKHSVQNKAANTVFPAATAGLIHAGVLCDDLLDRTSEVFGYTGHLFQVWDDFMEHYAVKEQSGKGAPDTKYNAKTWATLTAMAHFNEAQAKEFKACYGSTDPAKRSRVRELYDEVNLRGLYIDYLRNTYMVVEEKISKIPDPRIQSACRSYMDWLLVEPPQDEEEAESVLNN
uniref:IDS-type sesquiterpene synthase n=2 Tax=Nezara viridula TaxID=85310 RepID=TPS_NEZVI|nr:RecName: Full=IDS-type sesquiterpene synthase; Short=NvIDS1; Short=NvTPS [Nezara viridula]AYD76069.1 terpene synthase [Nezara viridula]